MTTATSPSPDRWDPCGAIAAGRYVVERKVGSGGFGIVYFARDQQLAQKRVVIKTIPAAADHG